MLFFGKRGATCLRSSIFPTHPARSIAYPRYLIPHQYRKQHSNAPSSPPNPTLAARIVSSLPPSLKPYAYLARLHAPVGSWLLYWPCAWSITLAAAHGHIPPNEMFAMLGLFGVGAVVMRGAGCTINDLWDRNLDKKVERTAMRPLAAGDLTTFQALSFLGVQLSLGLAVLTQLNWYSIVLGAASLSLVVTYPLFKRITYWPQMVLGLAFNWGALLGWPALLGGDLMAWSIVLPLYTSGIFWTLVYDTIYAHQDKSDDVKVGIKSTALRFGSNTKPILTAFTLAQLSLLSVTGVTLGAGIPLYAGVVAAGGIQGWMIYDANIDDPKSCAKWFLRNVWTGGVIWLGCLGEWALRLGGVGLGSWFSVVG